MKIIIPIIGTVHISLLKHVCPTKYVTFSTDNDDCMFLCTNRHWNIDHTVPDATLFVLHPCVYRSLRDICSFKKQFFQFKDLTRFCQLISFLFYIQLLRYFSTHCRVTSRIRNIVSHAWERSLTTVQKGYIQFVYFYEKMYSQTLRKFNPCFLFTFSLIAMFAFQVVHLFIQFSTQLYNYSVTIYPARKKHQTSV